MSKSKKSSPKQHHLDRRAADLVATPGGDDELLNTAQLAAWLGCSPQWVEIGRHKGYGPRFERLGPRCIRYRRGDVRAWLSERSHVSTNEYADGGQS
jgi:predicted DNA-binding transcriptional regulator AlpA